MKKVFFRIFSSAVAVEMRNRILRLSPSRLNVDSATVVILSLLSVSLLSLFLGLEVGAAEHSANENSVLRGKIPKIRFCEEAFPADQ